MCLQNCKTDSLQNIHPSGFPGFFDNLPLEICPPGLKRVLNGAEKMKRQAVRTVGCFPLGLSGCNVVLPPPSYVGWFMSPIEYRYMMIHVL